MKAVVLLVKIMLAVAVVEGIRFWVGRGITCSLSKDSAAECDLRAIESALAMKRLTAKGASPAEPCVEEASSRKDPWGNPYQSFVINDPESNTPDIRVYSMGQDGRSSSAGNDPDDINSWNDHHQTEYRKIYRRDHLRGHIILLLIFTPLAYAFHSLQLGASAIRRIGLTSDDC